MSLEKQLKKAEERLEKEKEELAKQKEKVKEAQSRYSKVKRKLETRLKIQIGAIFMKYFDISSLEEAESVARQFAEHVREHKHYQKNEEETS